MLENHPASSSEHRTWNWRQVPGGVRLLFLLFALQIFNVTFSSRVQEDLVLKTSRNIDQERTGGYVPYPKIFGHLHAAKTAGTEINGELAARYERVCGHKGYSYDGYQFNERVRNYFVEQENQGKARRKANAVYSISGEGGEDDIISKAHHGSNRGRVPIHVMKEIGFEDCDYISLESSWMHWNNTVIPRLPAHTEIELHIPCREPVEYLMSQCNFKKLKFDCGASDLRIEISGCLVGPSRFHKDLRKIPALDLKCFNPIPIEPYMDYMGQHLQEKRFPHEYVHRETNQPRDKSKECIWFDKEVENKVLDILLDLEYTTFCKQCMTSSDNLLQAVDSSSKLWEEMPKARTGGWGNWTDPSQRYFNERWEVLPDSVISVVLTVGITEDSWNHHRKWPKNLQRGWFDLSEMDKKAMELLGYNVELWEF